MIYARIIALGILVVLAPSCSSLQMRMDHNELRKVLMDYTEDQVLDNAIRAYNHRAIMHFDIQKVDAVVKSSVAANASGGQTWTNAALRSVVRPFALGTGSSRDNTLTVTMAPALDKNEVYSAYEAFVALDNSIRVGKPDEPVLVGKKWREDGQYYWIPQRYAKEYFQLCLRTSVKRGEVKEDKGASAGASHAKASNSPKSIPQALRSPASSPDSNLSPEAKMLRDAASEIRQLRIQ